MSQVPSTLEERAGATTSAEVFPSGTNGASRVTVIKPAPRLPHLSVSELWHYRELLGRLVWRDVVVR